MFPRINPATMPDTAHYAGLSLLSLFVFVSPFPHTQTIGEISFYAALLIFSYLSLRLGVKIETYGVWTTLLMFGGWCIVSSVFALDPYESFADLYSHFAKYLILTVMLAVFFASRQRLVLLASVIMYSGVTFALTIMVYFYGVLDNDLTIRMGLPRWSTNTMGFVFLFSLALIFPLFRNYKEKLIRYGLFCSAFILIVASLLTQSRGTFIALVTMSLVFCYQYRKILVIAMVLLITAGILTPNLSDRFAKSNKHRTALFLYTVEIIKDFPVTGIGFARDTYRDPAHIDSEIYTARIPKEYRDAGMFTFPHNMILDVTVKTGLIGTFLFCGFWGMLFLTSFRLLRQTRDRFIKDWTLTLLAASVMFAVRGMFEPTTTHFVLTILHTILAMLIILLNLQSRSHDNDINIKSYV